MHSVREFSTEPSLSVILIKVNGLLKLSILLLSSFVCNKTAIMVKLAYIYKAMVLR